MCWWVTFYCPIGSGRLSKGGINTEDNRILSGEKVGSIDIATFAMLENIPDQADACEKYCNYKQGVRQMKTTS